LQGEPLIAGNNSQFVDRGGAGLQLMRFTIETKRQGQKKQDIFAKHD
jgi:hypothetical protein